MNDTDEMEAQSHQSNTGGACVDFVIDPATDESELVPVGRFNAGSVELWPVAADYGKGGMSNGMPVSISIAFHGVRGVGVVEYVHIDDEAMEQIGRLHRELNDCVEKNAGLLENNMKLLRMYTSLNEQYVAHLERPYRVRVRDFFYDLMWSFAALFGQRSSSPTKMFDPARTTPPDKYGYFYHPDIPGEDEGDDVRALCRDMGFDATAVAFEYDAPEELSDDYFEREDQTAVGRWNPTPPPGDGWQLVAKYDTEDGPYGMFVRPLQS